MKLHFVTCVSQVDVLNRYLLNSPCLQRGGHPLTVRFNASSAAEAFNAVMSAEMIVGGATWLVWVHQDVLLPLGWDTQFLSALESAQCQFPQMAVAGVYGVAGSGASLHRAGHVLDRGHLLKESTPLPCLVDSLDELLFAVRVDSGLRLDPALGFDFYATDVILQAQERGLQGVAVDAYCEHWSGTPVNGPFSEQLLRRIQTSGECFEKKWQHRLPLTTPCFPIHKRGDVAGFIAQVVNAEIYRDIV